MTKRKTKPVKVGVLVSGKGTNLQALIDASQDEAFPAEIVLVISNKKDAFALDRAKRSGIKTSYISHKDYDSRESFDRAMHEQLVEAGVDCVCMAGFMRLLSEWFVEQWYNRLINIHPSLLPSFKGLDAQQQAIEYGVKVAGCTVHFVRSQMDVGPIIVQKAVDVYGDDTVDSLNRRILAMEHVAYVEVLELFAQGRLKVVDERVKITSLQASSDDASAQN